MLGALECIPEKGASTTGLRRCRQKAFVGYSGNRGRKFTYSRHVWLQSIFKATLGNLGNLVSK